MIQAIRNNPVMLIAGIVAIVNILISGDQAQTASLIESFAILAGGLVARAKVTPYPLRDTERQGTE